MSRTKIADGDRNELRQRLDEIAGSSPRDISLHRERVEALNAASPHSIKYIEEAAADRLRHLSFAHVAFQNDPTGGQGGLCGAAKPRQVPCENNSGDGTKSAPDRDHQRSAELVGGPPISKLPNGAMPTTKRGEIFPCRHRERMTTISESGTITANGEWL
jgi:hypothetical protein